MTEDARFEDGGDSPLRLKALEAEDLGVISSLAQDAVFPVTEMKWDKRRHRFAILINRFRWEDADLADRRDRPFERVQSVLTIEDAMHVTSQGIDRSDGDFIMSLLAVDFDAGEDGTGRIMLTLAGDGAIAIEVEALEVSLTDVTRPYVAPSGKVPQHPE
ncbi:MAG: DUF2948 family protein [Boseongicola sp.]|nr:MAG: DUF2948 family protein [Boseongicola sp.]